MQNGQPRGTSEAPAEHGGDGRSFVIAPREPPASLLPSLNRIASMVDLPPNWNSYGAVPPTARALTRACVVAEEVAERQSARGGARVAPRATEPMPNGGVWLEWHHGNSALEIHVEPDGSLGYLLEDGGMNGPRYEEADVATSEEILAMADRLFGSR